MTPKRKKYLASISKEEQLVRKQLRYYHREIVGSKWDMKFYKSKGVSCFLNGIRENIRNYKVIVKLLKKQLPAPRTPLELNEVVFPCTCSVCKYPFTEDNYCPCCGQKLR